MSTNLFERLRALTPSTPLLIGEVMSINSDGTSTVEYPDGSRQAARGTIVPVGGHAFVRNGVIEMAAPGRIATVIEL